MTCAWVILFDHANDKRLLFHDTSSPSPNDISWTLPQQYGSIFLSPVWSHWSVLSESRNYLWFLKTVVSQLRNVCCSRNGVTGQLVSWPTLDLCIYRALYHTCTCNVKISFSSILAYRVRTQAEVLGSGGKESDALVLVLNFAVSQGFQQWEIWGGSQCTL